MKLCILQTDPRWMDVDNNLERLSSFAANLPQVDVILLPEMFNTGFVTQPGVIAEPPHGKTLQWAKRQARRLDAALAGTWAVRESGRYFNRFHFVYPDGNFEAYDKRHLFGPGAENRHYTAGTGRVVVVYQGFRILLQTCYDLRFPVFSRNRDDYDIVVYASAWPEVRIDAFHALLRARAIENQAWAVGVNRCGDEPDVKYCGRSALYDYKGRELYTAGDTESVKVVDLDINSLNEFRNKFPVWKDADSFCICNENVK